MGDPTKMLLSVFCGVGGLDLGFETEGFQVGVAIDKNPDSIASYNHNRCDKHSRAKVGDVTRLTPEILDQHFGSEFRPIGVIGGPPCQSFSQSNRSPVLDDPRHDLPIAYAALLKKLNQRSPVHFFVFENVTGLCRDPHLERYERIRAAFKDAGFTVTDAVLNANDYRVAQSRERLIIVGYNKSLYGDLAWVPPAKSRGKKLTVKSAIHGFPEPVHYRRDLRPAEIPFHRNHWCMAPKSEKFRTKSLKPGVTKSRSFKTLSWEAPSITVAYGHREVHVHPSCHRRLSVLEAMRLQGFPRDFELLGSLSSQIQQVSEAVPPPMAESIARSIIRQLEHFASERTCGATYAHPPISKGYRDSVASS
jgi:DNA (cytosine-5)-methyltransferase 1